MGPARGGGAARRPIAKRWKESRDNRKRRRLSESDEIELLEQWIDSMKPESGFTPLPLAATPPSAAAAGRSSDGSFSPYSSCRSFSQLPLSQKTQDGLAPKYTEMSEIQRASLPHSLCGRDILGAAKTGSGKTLAFIIPVIEKLYRLKWGELDGVGCIIVSPTKELAGQIFEELNFVGKHHDFRAGVLVGGRDVDAEKQRVNDLNILVCTPGRLLQHMDETPDFNCSNLEILVLDEADRILDAGFMKQMDAIISQLPKGRQTLLFSATQTKSVKDLARLSLKDPEYISVHEKAATATPDRLKQVAMEVPLDQKLNMLYSFIRSHLKSKILVFLSTCKQVKFVYETFRKLRPGISLLCLHGRMKQSVRMAIYSRFCESSCVLFATDVGSRGLDFPAVDWVVQVDCPEDIPTYLHRVGRTARFRSEGKSVLFLLPSEAEMLKKLLEAKPKIPIVSRKANTLKIESISSRLSSLYAQYENLTRLAEAALRTYLKSIHKHADKKVFDVQKLPVDDFAASLGLTSSPKIRFLKQKVENKSPVGSARAENGSTNRSGVAGGIIKSSVAKQESESDDDVLLPKEPSLDVKEDSSSSFLPKKSKKKLKINVHRPSGTRVVFDDDGNVIPPLAAIAQGSSNGVTVQLEKVNERYKMLQDELKRRDKGDKVLHRERLREKRIKEKAMLKRGKEEGEDSGESDEDDEAPRHQRSKKYFDSDDEGDVKGGGITGHDAGSLSTAQQEVLALELLNSMHS